MAIKFACLGRCRTTPKMLHLLSSRQNKSKKIGPEGQKSEFLQTLKVIVYITFLRPSTMRAGVVNLYVSGGCCNWYVRHHAINDNSPCKDANIHGLHRLWGPPGDLYDFRNKATHCVNLCLPAIDENVHKLTRVEDNKGSTVFGGELLHDCR